MAVTTPPDNPDVPQTRGAWATARLRSAILLAELAPGEEIREARLAREWGVSPTPLREALRSLAAEGLVVQQAQRVTRVAELPRDETIEVYALRLVLEPLALRAAMARRPPGRAGDIRRACEELSAATVGTADAETYERAHRAFHRSLVAGCGSATILDTLEGLWDRSMRFRYFALRQAEEEGRSARPEMLYAGHDRLRDACVGSDPDEACRELNEHIFVLLRQVLDKDELRRVTRLREELPKLSRSW
jgi:DNA-binding GntR family transcriptional regulator